MEAPKGLSENLQTREPREPGVYTLHADATLLLDEIRQGTCKDSIIHLLVDPETCQISVKGTLPFDGSSRKERLNWISSCAKKEGPSLFVFRTDMRSNSPEWALLVWAPKSSISVAERAFYFTALSWLSSSFVDTNLPREFYVTEEAEMPVFKWT
ncbi:hypothetical protein, conserved [Eimeria tenella]|uniref:ADF-H domain-containing protein n=1 Tax=Eimeria tenella TaxID=5802 RepID=U6KT06_EIMTE|nr:hypothetical protein, conserved [Eimeria tenella]CDJ38558.1 hypothetical protein, conserved [Eimeria tenella]|eukprot:XP_013229396.1 hypothetical protein, conserved [Eimeria tenella]